MIENRLTIRSTIFQTSDIRIESWIPTRKTKFEDGLFADTAEILIEFFADLRIKIFDTARLDTSVFD